MGVESGKVEARRKKGKGEGRHKGKKEEGRKQGSCENRERKEGERVSEGKALFS